MIFDMLIRGGTCVTPSGSAIATIGIRDGKIAAIGEFKAAAASVVVEARGLHVLPGVIDSQVHFREPGLEHKEDMETGTRGAILGGVTAICEMPNTKPLTLTEADLTDKLKRASGRAWCDYAFFMGGSAANVDHLAKLELLPGCAGIKVFMGSSTGDLLVPDDETLGRILHNGYRRVAIHAEDEPRLTARKGMVVPGTHVREHCNVRDVEAGRLAVERLLRLAVQHGRRVHVLHISSAEELELLAQRRDFATVEVTPQHLTFTAPEAYDTLGTYAQMNPPIRELRHREALWAAVNSGLADVLGSDHAPHTKEEKAKPYPESPSGMTGVQTLVPVMLDHVASGRLTLQRFVDLACDGPAKTLGIMNKGRIARGYDADFTLVDLKAKRTIDTKDIASRSGWTPYDQRRVVGWPISTIIRGVEVMRDGAVIGSPTGQAMRF